MNISGELCQLVPAGDSNSSFKLQDTDTQLRNKSLVHHSIQNYISIIQKVCAMKTINIPERITKNLCILPLEMIRAQEILSLQFF